MRNLLANLKRFIDSLDSGMYDVMFASFSTIIVTVLLEEKKRDDSSEWARRSKPEEDGSRG